MFRRTQRRPTCSHGSGHLWATARQLCRTVPACPRTGLSSPPQNLVCFQPSQTGIDTPTLVRLAGDLFPGSPVWPALPVCVTRPRHPPAWVANHSQWRGISVTSRATTPNFGRPSRRVSPSDWLGPVLCAEPALWSLIRRETSSGLPRRSTSTKLLVTSSKIRTCAHFSRSITAFALSATRSRSPEAMRLAPTKAVQRVVGGSIIQTLYFTRI
jgi:hypothetical protein